MATQKKRLQEQVKGGNQDHEKTVKKNGGKQLKDGSKKEEETRRRSDQPNANMAEKEDQGGEGTKSCNQTGNRNGKCQKRQKAGRERPRKREDGEAQSEPEMPAKKYKKEK